jgi:putative PEP-CTERM system integral membrane protein
MELCNIVLREIFAVFFWVFNGMLLLIVYVGVLPFMGFSLLGDALARQVPLNLLVTFFGLVSVPTTCSILGTKAKWRQEITLFQLFYGIEAPLLIVCIARFFWLRDLTVASTFLLLTIVFGTITTAHWLLSRRDNPMAVNLWHLAGQTLMLAIAVYLTALAAFYALPILAGTMVSPLMVVVYTIVALPFVVFMAGLVTLPLGMVRMYLRSRSETLKQLGTRYGEWRVRAFTDVIFAGWLLTFLLLQQQPQVVAFRLLSNPPQTDAQRQALLQKSNTIRTGLLNAYLSPYRYPRLENTAMRDLYQTTLRFPQTTAQIVQHWFNFLTAPFTYQGTAADVDKAAQLYAQFFDAPILRKENPAIQKALQSTFDRSGAKAGLDNINQKRVWLEQQNITVTPHGDWADVEIHEVYQNKTTVAEEILYYFSLPESAAITGVWLSDDANVPKKYPFVISPRGAAQQVYNNQVVRNVDPALLEQVGPQQYRLRAFPVPPKGQTFLANGIWTDQPTKMYLWFSYKVLKQEAGWRLPELREQRNIFWTKATKRVINGKKVSGSNQWLPATLPADKTPATAHQMTLPWGARVLATPFAKNDYQLPQGKRFAVILDSSYSMKAHRQQVTDTFRWLKDNILKQNIADLYLTKAETNPQRLDNFGSFDPQKVLFYGMVQPKDMLAQFQQLRGNTNYDAIVVITDPGSYELNSDRNLPGAMPAPVWFVHLGGLAFGYDDATLKAIQDSDGGVATEVQTVMQRIGTQPSRGMGTSFLNLVDGYAWYLTKDDVYDIEPANEGFGALAARQWATHLSRYLQPDEMKELDAIHATAKQYGIVTPYSSMIVLVNDQQRQQLKYAEQQGDRFDREVEDQQLPQPNSNIISGVPEPAEWLLLIVGAVALWGVYQYQQDLRILN